MPTQYLHSLSGELKKEIEDVGEFAIIDLEGPKARKDAFENALENSNLRLVILNGHGTSDSVWGHNEVILDKSNIKKLNSKIIYAVVCDSAFELGELAVNEGAEAYIGYESKFMIIVEPSRSATPMKDKNFKPFVEVYASLVIGLISGFTVIQTIEKTKNRIRSLIKDYGVQGIRDRYGDAPLIRFALYWDLFFLKHHGNPDAIF